MYKRMIPCCPECLEIVTVQEGKDIMKLPRCKNPACQCHTEKAEGIPSPFAPKISKKEISDEEMEAVKKLLGVKCLFIIADTEKHDCTAATCLGHDYTMASSGFTDDQLAGAIVCMAEDITGVDLRTGAEED